MKPKQIWKTYTVVGYWLETNQRWSAYYKARSHGGAENKALKNDGLVIVASFEGELKADPFTKIIYS